MASRDWWCGRCGVVVGAEAEWKQEDAEFFQAPSLSSFLSIEEVFGSLQVHQDDKLEPKIQHRKLSDKECTKSSAWALPDELTEMASSDKEITGITWKALPSNKLDYHAWLLYHIPLLATKPMPDAWFFFCAMTAKILELTETLTDTADRHTQ
jgi:hypothetical protein